MVIRGLTWVFWAASWLLLFIGGGIVLIASFKWRSAELAVTGAMPLYFYYLLSSLALSAISRSLSEVAQQAQDHKNQKKMAESLKRYVVDENAVAAAEDEYRRLKMAS
jgi:hypothetical protein